MKAQRESRGIATLSLTLVLDGVVGQRHAPAALPTGKRLGTRCIGGWVATGPFWTGAENIASTGIRAPDRPARTGSNEDTPNKFSSSGPRLLAGARYFHF
jgi:hypothetical protein